MNFVVWFGWGGFFRVFFFFDFFFLARTRPAASMRALCLTYLSTSNYGNFFVHPLAVLSHLRARFSYILDHCGRARSHRRRSPLIYYIDVGDDVAGSHHMQLYGAWVGCFVVPSSSSLWVAVVYELLVVSYAGSCRSKRTSSCTVCYCIRAVSAKVRILRRSSLR